MASWREEYWKKLKPKCKGCMYQGTDLPCEYILITGKSPQSQGAHIDPEGPGGCELYKSGKRIDQRVPLGLVGSTVSTFTARERKTPQTNKLEALEYFEMHRNGACDSEIAKAAGVSVSTVRRWRFDNKLPLNDGRKTEEFSNQRKGLSFDEKTALKLYRAGKLDREIAEKCGVRPNVISRWRSLRGLEANRFSNARKKAMK